MKQHTKGELAVLLSVACLAIMAILVKNIPGRIDGLTVAFFRFVIGIPLSVAAILILKQPWKVEDKKDVFLRGLFGAAAMILYFSAIVMGSPGRATLLNRTAPFFVALWGLLFFKQKVKWWQILIIVACFSGVVLVFYDHSSYPLLGDIFGLGSALLLGLGIIFVKRARVQNEPAMIYLILCIIGAVMAAPFVPWRTLDITQGWWMLLIMGGVSWIAQISFSWGLKFISALEGAIITYLHIPLTLGLSVLFVTEEITTTFIIGTVIIFAGLTINTILENRKKNNEA